MNSQQIGLLPTIPVIKYDSRNKEGHDGSDGLEYPQIRNQIGIAQIQISIENRRSHLRGDREHADQVPEDKATDDHYTQHQPGPGRRYSVAHRLFS